MDYRIFPPEEMAEPADVAVALPTSKSILNRLLIINAIAGNDVPEGIADSTDGTISDDSRLLAEILAKGMPRDGETIDIGAAGTAMRFLTAFYAATEGVNVVLDGIERMRNRPIGDLVDTLRSLGADIRYSDKEGFPPLMIRGKRLSGGSVAIDGSVSSQFTSALLMVAPLMQSPLTLTINGEIASNAYLKMTMGVMEACGIEVSRNINILKVSPGSYDVPAKTFTSVMEADWSSASYFYEIAALSACEVAMDGLSKNSLQGDSALVKIFEQLGVLSSFNADGVVAEPSPEIFSTLNLDMSDTPDLVPAVAVAACMLRVPFRMSGVRNLRVKETDRIAALITELDKFGCTLETDHGDDVLLWEGKGHPVFEIPTISTYGDHRIAMAFAPTALYCPAIIIKDIEVVSKSFPSFWQQLEALGFNLSDPSTPIETPETES